MKKRMAAVLVLCLIFCMHGVVFAAQSEPAEAVPDLTRDCSITVHLQTVTKEPVLDGSVQLVQVALAAEGDAGQYYKVNPAFGTLPFDPVEERFEAETAETLAGIALKSDIPYSAAPFSEGVAVFTALSPGLYLLLQSEEVLESYTAMPPCLVLAPELQKDGTLQYDVDAFPKPVKTVPPDEVEFKAEKQIVCSKGQAPAGVTFSFILTPETPDQPMPESADTKADPKTGAVVVAREGKGEVSFGKMPIEKKDIGKTYRYTMREVKGSVRNFTYDDSVFTVTVSVKDGGNGEPKATVTVADEKAKSYTRIVFINVYSPPDEPDIPRTGQLWWPVAVCGAAGVLLLAVGIVRRRKGAK